MGEFRKSDGPRSDKRSGFRSGGDRPQFGRRGGFGGGRDRDDGPKQMFSATCAQCGKSCEVPFRPSGERPVYCNDCFSSKRVTSRNDYDRRDAPRSFDKRGSAFSPALSAPVEDKRFDELKQKIDALHKKIDAVIAMMEGTKVAKSEKSLPEQDEPVEPVKKARKKKVIKK